MSLSEAVSSDRLAGLQALRDVLAQAIDSGPKPAELAALSRQLTDVLSQIEAVEKAQPEKKGTALDELTSRRSARESKSSNRSRA